VRKNIVRYVIETHTLEFYIFYKWKVYIYLMTSAYRACSSSNILDDYISSCDIQLIINQYECPHMEEVFDDILDIRYYFVYKGYTIRGAVKTIEEYKQLVKLFNSKTYDYIMRKRRMRWNGMEKNKLVLLYNASHT